MIAPDTSVLIAALAPWHEAHSAARAAVRAGEVRLPAHVALETTSALSRMPEGRRIAATVVLEAIRRGFQDPWLSIDGERSRAALLLAVGKGVRGGALYDALIAATATAHGARILSNDRRARATYDAMGASVTFLDADHASD